MLIRLAQIVLLACLLFAVGLPPEARAEVYGLKSCGSDRVDRPVAGSAPPRNRTCGFPAYGSSKRVCLQPGVGRQLGIADPDARPNQRVLGQEDFEVLPAQAARLAPR